MIGLISMLVGRSFHGIGPSRDYHHESYVDGGERLEATSSGARSMSLAGVGCMNLVNRLPLNLGS